MKSVSKAKKTNKENNKRISNHVFSKRKTENQIVAEQRIDELFKQAEEMVEKEKSLANKYAQLARKIALKYKLSFSREQKLSYCKKCFSYLKIGKNAKIRVVKGKIILSCLECKNITRFGYKKSKSSQNKA